MLLRPLSSADPGSIHRVPTGTTGSSPGSWQHAILLGDTWYFRLATAALRSALACLLPAPAATTRQSCSGLIQAGPIRCGP